MGADAEGRTECRVVAVDKAEEFIRPGVLVGEFGGQAAAQPALVAGAERPGLGQFEVPVDDRDVGQEGQRVGAVDLLVDGGHGTQGRRGGAAAKEELLEGAVRRAGPRQHQTRDAGDVGTGVQPQDVGAVARGVPDQTEAGLEVVEIVGDRAVRRETGIVDVGREVCALRFDQRVRVPGSLPAETEVQHDPVGRLPRVLEEESDLVDVEGLLAQVLRGDAGNGRGLQVEEDGSGDLRAGRAGAGGAARAVGAGHVAVALFHEADEAVHRVEDVAAVAEADELLADRRLVHLDAGLEQMVAEQRRDVVDQLPAFVGRVRADGQEERQADAEAVREVHADVGEGPAAETLIRRRGRGRHARLQRPAVGPGTVLPRPLQPELVRRAVAEQGTQAEVDGVRVVLLDAVRGQTPGIDVEGAVHLLRPRVVVLDRSLVPLAQVEVQLGDQGAVVVGALDGSELVVEQAGPAAPQEAVEPREVGWTGDLPDGLFRFISVLLVVGAEEEHPLPPDRSAEREAVL